MNTIEFYPAPRESSWCIFSHYDPNGNIEQYVIHYLTELKSLGFNIVFVTTNTELPNDKISSIAHLIQAIILRENVGYDFGSYKTGINYLQERTKSIEKLLIANDSVFGPLNALEKVIEASENYDLFGITDSYDHHYHLQSYFIIYSKDVLRGKPFQEFWKSVELCPGSGLEFKQRIIKLYEVGGSQHFIKHGYSIGAFNSYQKVFCQLALDYEKKLGLWKLDQENTPTPLTIRFNASHQNWDLLIKMGCPFIKRELLLKNPANIDTRYWASSINESSEYPVDLIIKTLINHTGSNDFFYDRYSPELFKKLSPTGLIELEILPSLKPWQARYSVNPTALFIFDESAYLEENPDVKLAVHNGVVPSGLIHYIYNGSKENRRLPLTRKFEHT